jgi:ribosomal protein S6
LAAYAREPRAYELMAILLPELADENLTGQIERVSKYITDVNGSVKEILNDSPWGRRRLAYTIRHNSVDYRDGIYVIWHFDLEPSRTGEIERELKLDTRVIRYLLVHDDPKWGPKNGGNQPQGEDADGAPTRESAPSRERAATPAAAAPVAEAPAESAPAEADAADETATSASTTENPVAEETSDSAPAEAAVDDAPVAEETSDAAPAEAAAPETAAVEETSDAPAADEATGNDAEKTEE